MNMKKVGFLLCKLHALQRGLYSRILNADVNRELDTMARFLYYRVQKDDRQEGGAVQLSFNEQMAVVMKRRGVSVAQLAERLGKSRQNVNNRLNNSDFTSAEMKEWAGAIGCDVSIEVIERQESGADPAENINK